VTSEHKLASPSARKQKRDRLPTDPERKTQSLITRFVSVSEDSSQNHTGEAIIDFGGPSTPPNTSNMNGSTPRTPVGNKYYSEVMKTPGKRKKTYVLVS
jgi:hypothetical protein